MSNKLPEADQKLFWADRVKAAAKKTIEGCKGLEERTERFKQKQYIAAYVAFAVQTLRERHGSGQLSLEKLEMEPHSKYSMNFAKDLLQLFQEAHPELHAWRSTSTFAQREQHSALHLSAILRKLHEQEPQDRACPASGDLQILAQACAAVLSNSSDTNSAVSGPSARYMLPSAPPRATPCFPAKGRVDRNPSFEQNKTKSK